MAQWNIQTQDYLNQERSLFEVVGVASSDGQIISPQNPFPVSVGNTVEVSFAPGGTGNIVSLADNWGNKADWRPQFTNNNRFKISPYQKVILFYFVYWPIIRNFGVIKIFCH